MMSNFHQNLSRISCYQMSRNYASNENKKQKHIERIIHIHGEVWCFSLGQINCFLQLFSIFQVICGYHSIKLALEASKRRFHNVYYCENNPKVIEIKEICTRLNISTKKCSRYTLNQLTKYTSDIQAPHKGVCAVMKN